MTLGNENRIVMSGFNHGGKSVTFQKSENRPYIGCRPSKYHVPSRTLGTTLPFLQCFLVTSAMDHTWLKNVSMISLLKLYASQDDCEPLQSAIERKIHMYIPSETFADSSNNSGPSKGPRYQESLGRCPGEFPETMVPVWARRMMDRSLCKNNLVHFIVEISSTFWLLDYWSAPTTRKQW